MRPASHECPRCGGGGVVLLPEHHYEPEPCDRCFGSCDILDSGPWQRRGCTGTGDDGEHWPDSFVCLDFVPCPFCWTPPETDCDEPWCRLGTAPTCTADDAEDAR